MPKNNISTRQKRRIRRINHVVKEALMQRSPGLIIPMTFEWMLRLVDNASYEHPGDPSQTLKLVKRACLRWDKPTTKRVCKCKVTAGTNLQLAADAILIEDQGPVALRRALFRAGVSKFSDTSARTLRSKAVNLTELRREQIAAEAGLVRLRRRHRYFSFLHVCQRFHIFSAGSGHLEDTRMTSSKSENILN